MFTYKPNEVANKLLYTNFTQVQLMHSHTYIHSGTLSAEVQLETWLSCVTTDRCLDVNCVLVKAGM
jgi:hypothetical protein